MKHTFISRSLAIGCLSAVLVLCACGREDIVPTPSDGTITFGASSSWRNFPDTKTAYSGELLTVSGSKYERIDWVPGYDRVRIVSNAASTSGGADYADYAVQAVSGTNASGEVESPAALSPVSGGLKWSGEEQAHYFYALYPSPTMTSEYERLVPEGYASVTMTTSGGTPAAAYSLVVPSSQPYAALVRDEDNRLYEYKPDMNLAYMSAAAKANAGVYDGVSLQFRPLVSTYEFTVMAADASAENLTLTAVTLTSSAGYLSGSFTTTVGPDGSFSAPELGSDKSNTVTVPVPAGADRKALSQSDGIRVTLFALPVEPDASETLTLDLTFVDASNAEVHRTLPLVTTDNTPITLPAGMKLYVRSLGVPGQWTYYLDDPSPVTLPYTGTMYETASLGTAFKSYKQLGTGEDAVKRAVPYKLQYSTDNGTTWSDTPPTWLPDAPTASEGSVTGETLPLEMEAQYNTGTDGHRDILMRRDTVGEEDNPFDLSTVNVATGATVARTTANCYVVSAPGYYKFPLVYGNGVKNGAVNESAYYQANPPADVSMYNQYLTRYKDHLDQDITDPYITNTYTGTLSAELLWTDAIGLVTNVDVTGSGEDACITFTVPKDRICQGNALISLQVGGTTVWSWHIWVTDENLTNVKTGGGSYYFSPVDVGWCEGRMEVYAERTCLVRAVQTETGGLTTSDDHVQAINQTETNIQTLGNSPFYEHGRKDPVQAAAGLADNSSKVYYGPNAFFNQKYDTSGPVSIGTAVQHPDTWYYGTSVFGWCSEHYANLWDSGAITITVDTEGHDPVASMITKSIYDPSPVGYKIPSVWPFWTMPNGSWESADVASFTQAGRWSSDGLFFPASGAYSYANDGGVPQHSSIGITIEYWYGHFMNAAGTGYSSTRTHVHESLNGRTASTWVAFPVRSTLDTFSVTGEDLGGWDTE